MHSQFRCSSQKTKIAIKEAKANYLGGEGYEMPCKSIINPVWI